MPRTKATRNKTEPLDSCLSLVPSVMEIGIDEAGKGPMFGRVYASAVCLSKDGTTFDHSKMKDSKRFHSKKKISETAQYIKDHALAWSVKYSTEAEVDTLNIRQATFRAMHSAARAVMTKLFTGPPNLDNLTLIVDGNDFKPIQLYNYSSNTMDSVPFVCIEGGDNKYSAIAAASILAKVSRDAYVGELVEEYPLLETWYGIGSNKGYGTAAHMDGIREHGITQWHRRTYGICRNYTPTILDKLATQPLDGGGGEKGTIVVEQKGLN